MFPIHLKHPVADWVLPWSMTLTSLQPPRGQDWEEHRVKGYPHQIFQIQPTKRILLHDDVKLHVKFDSPSLQVYYLYYIFKKIHKQLNKKIFLSKQIKFLNTKNHPHHPRPNWVEDVQFEEIWFILWPSPKKTWIQIVDFWRDVIHFPEMRSNVLRQFGTFSKVKQLFYWTI